MKGRERDWIVRIRRGDADALDEVYAEYGARLCAYVYRWTYSSETAEEIVQEIFLAIWRNRAQWDLTPELLKPYLFRAARNRLTNHLRRQQLERRLREPGARDALDGMLAEPPPLPDEQLRHAELRRSVHGAVAALPDRCREIFLLNREQGLTYSEIAQLLGVTVKTVEYHMGRAFTLLRRQLAEWGPDASAKVG